EMEADLCSEAVTHLSPERVFDDVTTAGRHERENRAGRQAKIEIKRQLQVRFVIPEHHRHFRSPNLEYLLGLGFAANQDLSAHNLKECFILGNLDDVGFEGLPESAEALDKLSGCYVAVTHEPANPSIDEYLDSPVRIGRLPHQIDEPARVGFRVAGKLQRQGYLEREPPVALWSVDVAVDSDVGPPGMSLRPGHTIEPLFREPATSNGGFDDD